MKLRFKEFIHFFLILVLKLQKRSKNDKVCSRKSTIILNLHGHLTYGLHGPSDLEIAWEIPDGLWCYM